MTKARERIRNRVLLLCRDMSAKKACEYIGRRVGLTGRAIEKIVDGESNNPNASTMFAFLRAFDVRLEWWSEQAIPAGTRVRSD